MGAVREYVVYGVSDKHKHLWPIQYHLLQNDFLAAIDCVTRGADILLRDCNGESGIELAYRLFFRTINKCLNSTLPISTGTDKNDVPIPPAYDHRKQLQKGEATELHGMADYNIACKNAKNDERPDNAHVFTSFVEYVIRQRSGTPPHGIGKNLVRRAKGLFAVIRVMIEKANCLVVLKSILLQHMQILEFPTLYASLMEYLFLNSKLYVSTSLNASDILAAKKLWQASSAKDAYIGSITTFMTEVVAILEELCGLFHVDIYSQSVTAYRSIYPGHDRQLLLTGVSSRTVEMLAHMAFIARKPVLFDVMVLQDSFIASQCTFRWHDLLSYLIGESNNLKAFKEPLMRINLRNNVEKRMDAEHIISNATVF